jgi:hypothetical protein
MVEPNEPDASIDKHPEREIASGDGRIPRVNRGKLVNWGLNECV